MTGPGPAAQVATWIAVIPFKGAPAGKSRMSASFDSKSRAELANAFLLDTVAAVLAIPSIEQVLIVSDAPPPALPDRVRTIPDPGRGLNAAVAFGVDSARELDAQCGVVVLTAALPLLTAAGLKDALGRASAHSLAVVADKDGMGTTMLFAAAGVTLEPQFGVDSLAAHLALGHQPLEVSATLRFDVDTAADLDRAVRSAELGFATRQLLQRIGRAPRVQLDAS